MCRDALDNLAVEVDQLLQDAGKIKLADQCQRFQLPLEFLVPVCACVGVSE